MIFIYMGREYFQHPPLLECPYVHPAAISSSSVMSRIGVSPTSICLCTTIHRGHWQKFVQPVRWILIPSVPVAEGSGSDARCAGSSWRFGCLAEVVSSFGVCYQCRHRFYPDFFQELGYPCRVLCSFAIGNVLCFGYWDWRNCLATAVLSYQLFARSYHHPCLRPGFLSSVRGICVYIDSQFVRFWLL